MTLTPVRRRRPPPRRGRRLGVLAAVVVVAAAAAAAAYVPHRTHTAADPTTSTTSPAATTVQTPSRRIAVPPRPKRLAEQSTGTLAAPVQDAAATGVPGGVMLLGGLEAVLGHHLSR